jgi:hypothetical protein
MPVPMKTRPQRRIVASAMLDPRGVAGVIPVRGEGSRPWDLYRQVPELRSGIEWLANAISRADLYIARRTDQGLEQVDDPRVTEIIDRVFGSGPSQSDMLKRMVVHLEVAGETYIVPYEDDAGDEVFVSASTLEIRSSGGRIEVQVDTSQWKPATGKALRIWYPDPVQAWRADSAVVAMEPVLRTIIAITSRTTAIGESRLAGNGILPLADTLSVEMPSSEGDANPVRSRDVVSALEDAMVTPMTDRGLVSSVVPLILVGPKEDLPTKDSWINMASPLDEQAADQLEQYLRRMATSLGLPPEIVLGLGESNHWNAYIITDMAVVTSVEPRTDVITSALTTGFLRPTLRQLGYEDWADMQVAADLSDLTIKPDRSEAADRARQQGLMTNEAWARHMGFDESVIPTGEERKQIILERLLIADPTTAPWVLPEIGIEVPGFTTTEPAPQVAQAETPADSGTVPEIEPATSDDGRPDETNPGNPGEPVMQAVASLTSVEDTVLAAIESAVLRVLERSNMRLMKNVSRTQRAGLKDVQIIDLHTHIPVTAELKEKMLRGAYDSWSETMPRLVPLVSEYVNYLIDNQLQHSREFLAETLIDRLGDYMPEVIHCA